MARRFSRWTACVAIAAASAFAMSGCAPVAPDGDGMLLIDISVEGAVAQSLASEITAAADAAGIQVETRFVDAVPQASSLGEDLQTEADLILTEDVRSLMELAGAGAVTPVSLLPGIDTDVLFGEVGAKWLSASLDAEGETVAFPVAASLSSVTFMNPLAFAEHGYQVPTNPAGFVDLVAQIETDNAGYPWCAGMENGDLTADPFIDWLAEYVLATAGDEVYQSWIAGETPTADAAIEVAATFARDALANHSSAKGKPARLLDDGFANTVPMFDLAGTYGKQCFFLRQSPDFLGFVPDTVAAETAEGSFRQISAFPFYGVENPTTSTPMVDAVFAGVGRVDKDVVALLSAMATAPFGDGFADDTAWVSSRGDAAADDRVSPFVAVNRAVLNGSDTVVLSPRATMAPDRLAALRAASVEFLTGEVDWFTATASVE